MRRFLQLLSLLLLATTHVRAGEDADFAAVRRADQQRIVATIAGDKLKLAALLSDDLRYAHGDGRVQSKAQLLAAVADNKAKYLSVVPQDVAFQAIAPGAVAMRGRARIAALADGRRTEFVLRFLAVWRDEAGAWRLLAYQSSSLAQSP